MHLTRLAINNQDVRSLLRERSLELTDTLDRRDTCRFTLLADPPVPWTVGQTVEVGFDNVLRFGGTIEQIEVAAAAAGSSRLAVRIEAVDYTQLADRRLAVKVYEGQTLKAIVQDLITTYLAGDGVTLDPAAPTGPTIDHVIANYDPVSTVLTRLCEQTGYTWTIDPQRVLHLWTWTGLLAPASLTATSGPDLADSFSARRTRETYRNTQYLRGGLAETDTEQVETFRGDSARRTFTLALPVAAGRVPTVRVNGVLQTVGVRQVDTGKQWYYEPESEQISQATSGTVLTSADVLEVRYIGQYPLVSVSRDSVALAERQQVEGGSGRYEQIEVNEEVTTTALARDRILGLLRQYGLIQQELTWTTLTGGWAAGQLVTVDRPAYGCTGDYLVVEVATRHRTGDLWESRIRAVGGQALLNWTAWWAELLRRPRPRRTQELVQPVEFATEVVDAAETRQVRADQPTVLDGVWVGPVADTELWRNQRTSRHWPGYAQVPSSAVRITSGSQSIGGANYGGITLAMPTDLAVGSEWELRLLVRGRPAGVTWMASWQSEGGSQNSLSFSFAAPAEWGFVRRQAVLNANQPVLNVFSWSPLAQLDLLAVELIRHTGGWDVRSVALTPSTYWPGQWTRRWTIPEGTTADGAWPVTVYAGHRINPTGALGGAQITVGPLLLAGRPIRVRVTYRTRAPHVAWVYAVGGAWLVTLPASPNWVTATADVTPSAPTSTTYLYPVSTGPEAYGAQLQLAAIRVEDRTLTRGSLVEGATVGLAEVAA